MNFIIEKARPEDAEEILSLSKTVGEETDNLTFGKEGIPISIETEKTFLANAAASDRSIFLVARKEGKIVGMANYSSFTRNRMSHRGEIGISIQKSDWGQGIGSELMQQLLTFARYTAKAEIVSLEVRSDNPQAIHLYEKFGFEKTGCFRGFFKIDGKLIDCDMMEKIF